MTPFKQPTRRMFLGGLAAMSMPIRAGANPKGLTFYGAPLTLSLPLIHVVDRDGVSPVLSGLRFRKWSSPDELRAGIASGAAAVSTAPTATAANLYNRGLGMRLLCVITSGMFYVMTTDPAIAGLADLAGRRVLVPFRGDLPDTVFSLVMRHQGLTPADIEIEYTASLIEAAQLMLAGRAPAAVLMEPAATMAQMRGLSEGIGVTRAIDLQALYGDATGGAADIPQAGIVLRDGLRDRQPDLAPRLLESLRGSTRWVRSNPASAGRLGADYLEMPKPILERAIATSNLSVRSAAEARPSLETFFNLLTETDPALIGGKLPDDGFYLETGA